MIATTVAEGTMAAGNHEPSSPTTEMNHDAKQQPSFCEPSTSDLDTETSRIYTDVEEDAFPKHANGIPHEGSFSSYWDLFVTAYAPLIVLWFRRSMLGPANLISTIVVGKVMSSVFVDDISEWMSEKLPPWLEVILFQQPQNSKGSSTMGSDPWPPPAFTGLALLTIFALVVHPDGLTWVLLGKLRDAIVAFFSALGQSLEFLLNDYGVLPTIFAATTLAAMFFLVFVVIRTLSPKRQKNHSDKHNNTLHNERKKKKKKGVRHRNNHHRSNRIKRKEHQQEEVENNEPEASPCSPIPSPPPSDVPEDTLSSPTLAAEKPMEKPELEVPSLSEESSTTTDNNLENSSERKELSSDKLPIPNVNKPKENQTRRRMMSGSTLDTTPLSDDQSCGSTSVRSFPSVSVNSNRSGGSSMKKNNKGSTPRRLKHRHVTSKSPKNTNRNNSERKHKSNAPNNSNSSAVDSSVTSRWDALKPEHGNAKHNKNAHGNHNPANGNTPNRKQNQPRNNRGNNSRRGTNGRKGRQQPKSGSRSPMRENVRPSPKGHDSKVSDNPFADSSSPSLPPPPPGFKKVNNALDFEPQQQRVVNKNNLLATPLFETTIPSPQNHNNNNNTTVTGMSPEFFRGPVQENPFSSFGSNYQNDRQIEAELQELGGQMAGSILDF